MHKLRLTRGRLVALAAIAAVAVAAAGTAVAAFPQDNVKLYTGCLTTGGTLVSVAEGNNPLQPCSAPRQVVKLSGGDITSLTVTAPLTGGGDNGALTIGLDASATLPSCASNNAVPKWNLSTSRWTCGVDNDTTYSADGTTLNKSAGNVFSIDPDYRVKNNQPCPSGQFANGIDENGTIQCAAAPAAGPATWIKRVEYADAPSPDAPGALIAELSLPAGNYVANATMTPRGDTGGDELSVECNLRLNGETPSPLVFGDAWGDVHEASIALADAFTFSEPGKLQLRCWSRFGSNHVESVRLVATQASSITVQ